MKHITSGQMLPGKSILSDFSIWWMVDKKTFSHAYFRSTSHSPGDYRNFSSNSYYDRKFLVFQELVSLWPTDKFPFVLRQLLLQIQVTLNCCTSSCGKGRQDFLWLCWNKADPASLCLWLIKVAMVSALPHTRWSDSLQQSLIKCILKNLVVV